MNQNTAVLFFTRTIEEEANFRQYTNAGKKINKAVVRKLIHHSKKSAFNSELPTFVLDSSSQSGDTFGERLANAFESIYSKGFDKVIAIGNDTPTLTSSTIGDAKISLQQNEVVLGPSSKGGVYLIGITKKAFNRNAFLNISWQTDDVYRELITNYCQSAQISVVSLEEKFEVEDIKSLSAFLTSGKTTNSLAKTLYSLLKSIDHSILTLTESLIYLFNYSFKPLRAPPATV